MRRIKLKLSYDGTDFHGWQVQPELATIQGTLEAVLFQIEGSPVHVEGSGRTDAGVHALEQVAGCSIQNPIPLDNLIHAMNRLLPPTIRILSTEEATPGFHPRFDAIAKNYEYRILRARICSPFEFRYVHYHPYPLDIQRMTAMAPVFEGQHDFTAFAASDDRDQQGASKVRTIFSSTLEEKPDRLMYRVRGSGFLKHMVRNMVGALIEGGKGNLDEDGLQELLASSSRKAGATAPAKGLCLVSVEYPSCQSGRL